MALKSPFLPLLLFSILLPFGALLILHRLQLLSKSVRSVRILHENNSSRPTNSSSNSSLVPALFIFGDSSADCGAGIINSWLQERADHLPYGRDFDTHRPTGRFCNGRITVDYLGMIFELLIFATSSIFGLWRACFGDLEYFESGIFRRKWNTIFETEWFSVFHVYMIFEREWFSVIPC